MKQSSEKALLGAIPRLNSLLHRLQQAPGQDDEPYLDQLMIFLDNPPPGVGDRWKKGAEMCAAWGVSCSHASVWRLYHSHAVEWRTRLALETGTDTAPSAEILEKTAAQMVAQRTCEILANPESTPNSLISLARIELRKEALEFARQKHDDGQRTTAEAALALLEKEAFMNFDAQFALDRLREALKNPKPSPFFKQLLPS